jgi:hypothetical protein
MDVLMGRERRTELIRTTPKRAATKLSTGKPAYYCKEGIYYPIEQLKQFGPNWRVTVFSDKIPVFYVPNNGILYVEGSQRAK